MPNLLKKITFSLILAFAFFLIPTRNLEVKAECKPWVPSQCAKVRCEIDGEWNCCDSSSECTAASGSPMENNPSDADTTFSGGTWYNQGFTEWYTKVYDTENPSEIFGERYTAAQVEWIVYGLFSFILNHFSDQETSVKCVSGDTSACKEAITSAFEKIQEVLPQGNLNLADESLASLIFSQDNFSGIGYFREKIEGFRLVSEAKAQTESGFGFSALGPTRELWAASRNIAYGLSVLVTIIFAFMIMFRVKISPQVVISVQSALPKVILAIIFVTFSYAIAGFMVDLMYVVIGLISLMLSGLGGDPRNIYLIMTEGYAGAGFLGLMGVYFLLFCGVLLFSLFASGNPMLNLSPILGPIILLIFVLVVIIMIIVLVVMFIRILWLLLKTTAQIYLLVIFGPLQIILGSVVPNVGIGGWIRSMAANLAVYPVVGTLFMLSQMFLFYAAKQASGGLGNFFVSVGIFKNLPTADPQWIPPLTLGTSYMPVIFVGISFVILTLIPKASDIIRSMIENKPFSYGSAIGEYTAVGGAYGLYSVSSLGQETGYWPFPFNLFLRGRNVPKWLNATADSLKRPLETVTSVVRGGK